MSSANEKKNIVIVGGGIIGCTSAYFLTRHPSFDPSKHTITLLEASQIAGGASGKAGGLLALWAYPKALVPLSYKLHKQLADEHDGENRWGYRAVHCGQVDCVGRLTSTKPTSDASSVSLQKRSNNPHLRAAGVPSDLDWVDPSCLSAYDEMGDPSTTAQVHPFLFTTAMSELARDAGTTIHTNAHVTALHHAPDNAISGVTYTDTATNTTHTLPATDILLAAGPWTRAVLPEAPISATRAHSITIRPSRPVSAYALFTQIQLPASSGRRAQHVSPEIYARPHNEVYACGEGDHAVPLPPFSHAVAVDAQRCEDIAQHVASISPELRDGEVTARQACYLPNVEGSSAPLVGPTNTKGLWLAAGHTCWGIQNAPATGKIVSEFLFDGAAKSAKAEGLDPRRFL